jgi:hypothetical protein
MAVDTPRLVTIASSNYWPYAAVTATSYLHHHPGGRVHLLIFDDLAGELELPLEGVEVVRAADLGIAPDEYRLMATIYGPTEMACALKPTLAAHVIERTGDTVVYADADVRFYGDTSPVVTEVGPRLGLTPHVLEPFADDGLTPDQLTLLVAGQFNAGMFVSGPDGVPGLRWWEARLARECRDAPHEGLVFDQRWLDPVSVLFSPHVVRHPGLNVGWWNVAERAIAGGEPRPTAAGQDLLAVHYSAFDPRQPERFSGFDAGRPRLALADNPTLAALARTYAHELLQAGWVASRSAPYGLGTGSDGRPLTKDLRLLLRTVLRVLEATGQPERPPDPFGPAGVTGLLAWLDALAARADAPTAAQIRGAIASVPHGPAAPAPARPAPGPRPAARPAPSAAPAPSPLATPVAPPRPARVGPPPLAEVLGHPASAPRRLAHLRATVPPVRPVPRRFGRKSDARALERVADVCRPVPWIDGYLSLTDAVFLYDMVTSVKPDRVLEIGTASGYSAAVILTALHDAGVPLRHADGGAALVSYDLSPVCYWDPSHPVGDAVAELVPDLRHGLELRQGTSLDASRDFADAPAGLAFVDANHAHPWPTIDLLLVSRVMQPGAWMVMHDVRLQACRRLYEKRTGLPAGWTQTGAEVAFGSWPHEKLPDTSGPGANIGAVRLPGTRRLAAPDLEAALAVPWEETPPPEVLGAIEPVEAAT